MTLDDRAAAAGLQRHWVDADGRPHQVDDAVLDAILARLDTRVADVPFLSTDTGEPLILDPASGGTCAELALEDGRTVRLTIGPDGRLPPITTIGYHRLRVAGREHVLAVAPLRCPQPAGRSWGIGVQIPALRGAHALPFGDLGTLAEAARTCGTAGAQAIAISPTHALFPADPTRFSPYAPSSRSFANVMLADPGLIGAARPPAPGAPALIDWREAIPDTLAHLRAAWTMAGDTVRDEVAAYRANRGEALEAHARFDALHAHLGGRGWVDWPRPFRHVGSDAVQRFATDHASDVAFYAFLQWLTDRGLAAAQAAARETMAIGVVADLAVGIDATGSHGWSRRHELLSGLTIGAPPDPLGPLGQNWGITGLDPFALARSGFSTFIETIRTALAHAGGLRIDHALGLDRLWVIPEGASAAEGAYLTMPGEHLRRIVAIEAARADAIIVGEDLGTVPPGFRRTLAARGMLGMRVLPFEREAQGGFVPPEDWSEHAVAMTGTHDTPTVAGWWTERDIDWAARLGRTDDAIAARKTRAAERTWLWRALGRSGAPSANPPLDDVLDHVARAPGPIALYPIEDLIGLDEQPNLPGTIDEHPNWRRRLPASTDTLLARPDIAVRTRHLTDRRPG